MVSATGWSSQPTSKQQVATGFFVSDAGYLITAHHVIEGLTDIRVVMSPRQVLRARTIKVDEQSDLALLKVDAITPFVYLSHSNGVPAGMDVITMGYPQVSVLGITTKVTRGIVNSERGMRDDPGSFQFSAEVQKGNSGGPLIGPGGMVVGVVRSKARRDQDVGGHQRPASERELRDQELCPDQVSGRHAGDPIDQTPEPREQINPVQLYDQLRPAIVPIVADQ